MIKTIIIWGGRIMVPVVMMALLAFLARVPLGTPATEGAIRLAWRMVGERIQVCRDYTASELEKLPKHMLRQQHCQNTLLGYGLQVKIDGEEKMFRDVLPSGARADRPLYVNEQFLLAPGTYELEVNFEPLSLQQAVSGTQKGEDLLKDKAIETALSKAKRFHFKDSVTVKKSYIWMLDLSESEGRFVVHQR